MSYSKWEKSPGACLMRHLEIECLTVLWNSNKCQRLHKFFLLHLGSNNTPTCGYGYGLCTCHWKLSLTSTYYVSVARFLILSVPVTFPYHIFILNPHTLRFRTHILKSYPYYVNRDTLLVPLGMYPNITNFSIRTRTNFFKFKPYTRRFRTSIFKSFRTPF